MYKIYGVQTNETIRSIANKLGIDAEVLGTINGLNVDTSLNPGAYIVVPNVNTYFNNYKVKKGDTIYEIARQNNIDPKQLLKLNGLNENDTIYVDQDIMLPGPNTNFYVTDNNELEKLKDKYF